MLFLQECQYFDSSTEGSVEETLVCGESSDHEDITGDESDDNTSGSLSDSNGEQVAGLDEPVQANFMESADSGTEGDEGPAPRYLAVGNNVNHQHGVPNMMIQVMEMIQWCVVKGASNQDMVVDKKAEDIVVEELDVEVEVMAVEVEDVEVVLQGVVAEDEVRDISQVQQMDLEVCQQILHPSTSLI